MTALAESGRSKLDVEISYSSSNPPHALSTAEFANSKQEPPHEPQRTRHHKQQGPQHHHREHEHQAKVSASTESQGVWSSKLRTVPLSIDFDVSVFATQDRHGRLTLHPVLRAADFASTASLPATVQPQITSRAVTQSLVYRSGGCGSQQGGAEGDLGRNNCAKASVNSQCPQFVRNGSHHNQPGQHKLAETDISTASRASCFAAIGDISAPSAAPPTTTDASLSANRPVTFDSAVLAATNSNELSTRRPEHAQQRCTYSSNLQTEDNNCDGLSLNGDGSYCSSVTAPSPIRAEPSSKTQSLVGRSAGCYEPSRSEMRLVRRPQQTQRLQRMRCEDSQSAMPRYSVVSESSRTSVMTNFRLPGGSQYPFTELVRVVHKLENLLDAINPNSQGSETASAPSVTAAAQMASVANSAHKGDYVAAAAASGVDQGRHRLREPRSNIDVTNLRHEYVKLFRD